MEKQKRTVDVDALVDQLLGIHVNYPTQQNIQLPNKLEDVKVIVTRTLGNGNSASFGPSYSLGMDSTVSLSADLTWKVKEGYNGPVEAEIHVFTCSLLMPLLLKSKKKSMRKTGQCICQCLIELSSLGMALLNPLIAEEAMIAFRFLNRLQFRQ